MKHTFPVTFFLIAIFFISQIIGLSLLAAGTIVTTDDQGNTLVTHEDTALGPRPDVSGFTSFTYIIIGVAIGTVVLLILIRFHLFSVWKLWFFMAVWLATTVALGAIIPTAFAVIIALGLAVWKIWRPGLWIHNITEVLVYSGIALLIAPIMDLFYMSLLLVVIAIYDAYAVWKSKHMVKMAEFQSEAKLFAGLSVPYNLPPTKTIKQTKISLKKPAAITSASMKTAVLGGGDIAFPLLFTGTVFDALLKQNLSSVLAFCQSMIIVVGATTALTLLLIFAKKDTFYPAMPFISAGCFAGYGIILLLHLL